MIQRLGLANPNSNLFNGGISDERRCAMKLDEFLRLLGTNAAKAEEYLQNPACPTEFKREYLNDFEEDKKRNAP